MDPEQVSVLCRYRELYYYINYIIDTEILIRRSQIVGRSFYTNEDLLMNEDVELRS